VRRAARPRTAAPRARILVAAFLAAWVAPGCARVLPGPAAAPADEALTLGDVLDEGDERRRASTHLVREGVAADASGEPDRALDRYRMALRVDPSNPWAYLALARHELEQGEADRALATVERSRSLLAREDASSRRAETQMLGLRGAALAALGRTDEARPLLAEARARAPGIWADGRLDAQELH